MDEDVTGLLIDTAFSGRSTSMAAACPERSR